MVDLVRKNYKMQLVFSNLRVNNKTARISISQFAILFSSSFPRVPLPISYIIAEKNNVKKKNHKEVRAAGKIVNLYNIYIS